MSWSIEEQGYKITYFMDNNATAVRKHVATNALFHLVKMDLN
jgi:hypothetical protein